MTSLIKAPSAIRGKYALIPPNQSIYLSKEKVIIRTPNGGETNLGASLFLELLPSPSFILQIKVPTKESLKLAFEDISVKLKRDPTLDWIVSSSVPRITKETSSLSITAKGAKSRIKYSATKNLKKCHFHLLNFDKYIGHWIKHVSKSFERGRIELNSNDWTILIDSTLNTDKNLEELRYSRGYAITHVGTITRKNGRIFTSNDVTGLASNLMYFLSFTRGSWVNPTLFSGKNKAGKEIWKGWFIHNSQPWKKYISWCDENHVTEILPPLFENFMKKVEDPSWERPIKQIIYWYIQTNTPNTDSGIILGQTALELLAWNYLVVDKKLMSKKQFNDRRNNSTSQNIRRLLLECKIPTLVPGYDPVLSGLAKPNQDGVDLITKARNNLVHPEKKVVFSTLQLHRLLFLQQWYIELILLSILDYHGKYFNRLKPELWVGDIESVPWI